MRGDVGLTLVSSQSTQQLGNLVIVLLLLVDDGLCSPDFDLGVDPARSEPSSVWVNRDRVDSLGTIIVIQVHSPRWLHNVHHSNYQTAAMTRLSREMGKTRSTLDSSLG